MVIGIWIELALELSFLLNVDGGPVGIGIGLISCKPIDLGLFLLQRPQHMVKRPVLHHQHNNVFQVVQPGRHRHPPHAFLRLTWFSAGSDSDRETFHHLEPLFA
jgi:hypothetical protein